MEAAAAAEISRIQQEQADFEKALLEKKLGAWTQFFTGFAQLAALGAEKNRDAAILSKALASAEAAINSYLSFTAALAQVPYPYNLVAAAGNLAAGLAQQAKILSTPLPGAETGGRFLVPDLSPRRRVDGVGLRVNPGETIDVTPRGESAGGQVFHFVFKMDEKIIWEIVNKGARAGELHALQMGRNL